MTLRRTLKTYYWLTKPGIIYGNIITATAGFFLAAQGQFDPPLFVSMVGGMSLVIASACVFNNYLDRDIDGLMTRTKKRALVSGRISAGGALAYGTILGVTGVTLLASFTNVVTLSLGLLGFVVYLGLYTPLKRRTVHNTLVGAIAGSAPIAAGYCAVTGQFDFAALLLFVILALWQMPHFYAIAMYRYDDYAAAGVHMLPVKRGIPTTKVQTIIYIIAFIIAALGLTATGITGYTYAVVMLGVGLAWLKLGWEGFQAPDTTAWAKRLFKFSLLVLVAFSVLISLEVLLP